jgi:hypothetical protein
MNHTDFFQEYQNKKKASEELFKGLQSKFVLNEGEVDEAFLGIKNPEEKKKEIEDYYHKITTSAPEWKKYKLFLGDKSDPQYVTIGEATPEQKKQALDIIIYQAAQDKFKKGASGIGASEKDKSVVAYTSKGVVADKEQDQQQNQQAPANYQVERKGKTYYFGKNQKERYTMEVVSPGDAAMMNYDWQHSELKYLFEPPLKFIGKQMAFDLKQGILMNFVGKWEGPFVGNTFAGIYDGESFQGNYKWDNTDFNPSKSTVKEKAIAFVDGTFSDRTNTGILGSPNILSTVDNFHLIQIPVGYSIEVLTNKQLRHTITVTKRLDGVNSNFTYYAYLGYEAGEQEPLSVTLSWEQIRRDFDNYQIGLSTKNIPGLLKLQSDESILELKIVKAGTPPAFTKKESFDDAKTYSEDLPLLSGLKSISPANFKNFEVDLGLTDDVEFENFLKAKNYINSPQFLKDLETIGKGIDYGKVKNVSKYPELVKIFTPDVLSEGFSVDDDYGSGGYGDYESVYQNNDPVKTATFKKLKQNLEAQYKDYFQKYGQYPDEFKEQMKMISKAYGPKKKKRIVNDPTSNVSATQPQSQKTPEDAALNRLDNFVKYFVEKIQSKTKDIKKTQEIKNFIFNAIKQRLQQYKQTVKKTVEPVNTTAVDPSAKQQIGKPFTAESIIRFQIRGILKKML